MPEYTATVEIALEEDPDADDDFFRINVFVVEASDGTRIDGASVFVSSESGAYESTKQTSSGVAQFNDVPETDFDVQVNATGYLEGTASVSPDDFVEDSS